MILERYEVENAILASFEIASEMVNTRRDLTVNLKLCGAPLWLFENFKNYLDDFFLNFEFPS